MNTYIWLINNKNVYIIKMNIYMSIWYYIYIF